MKKNGFRFLVCTVYLILTGESAMAYKNTDSPLANLAETPISNSMETEWIELRPKHPHDDEKEQIHDGKVSNVRNPSIGAFRASLGEAPRSAVVICPGGGYNILSINMEGVEIAQWMNSIGIDAYVLKYRLKEFGYPAPLQDVTDAIRYLRKNAKILGINPEKIGVMGFSAGGHTAAMATTLYNSPDALPKGESTAVSARPDFSILAYPVISMYDPVAHAGSRLNLLGDHPDPDLLNKLSLAHQVDENTPPVFLIHTAEDNSVPVENSLEFATAMAAHNRPFALHVFPRGPHGIGMRPQYGETSTWPTLLAGWLKELEITGITLLPPR